MSATGRTLRLAVDVGGTFTDVTLFDPATGSLLSAKTTTTPQNRALGVLDGIHAALQAADANAARVAEVVHGSTTGTNALIERTGARVGLLTTQGFRDVLEIGRIMRPDAGLYDFSVDLPLPLVPRHLRLEVPERLDAQGKVLLALDERAVIDAARIFAREGVEAVAVCFLFAFLDPRHEEAAERILAKHLPGVPISLSSRVCPEIREYERSSTTVINAYLTPVMSTYLDSLQERLHESLGPVRLSVIQANGGATSIAAARRKSVTTVNSGPAGGVVAAAFYGRRNGRDRLVSVDMGGTSFDIGLVENGVCAVTTEGSFQGLPVRVPIIDLHIIGAGGGSIAFRDPGGAIQVGPQSAGAEPGPACYGRGGTRPTVTDANLVLGRLSADYFNGGRMRLHAESAHRAVRALAEQMGMSVEETALGIVRVVNANMAKGIAAVTILRGIDVRDFSLLSFGGAGGVHAVELARALSMREAIVPPLPGTFSAVGLLVTDVRHDYVVALGGIRANDVVPGDLEASYRELEREAAEELVAEGFQGSSATFVRIADLKVAGQTYELSLPLPERGPVTRTGVDALLDAFARLYRERYAFFFDGEPIEIVNLRLAALGHNDPIVLPAAERGHPDPAVARKGTRPVYFESAGFLDTAIYERSRLRPGMVVEGPALVEEQTSSTLVPPGSHAEVLEDFGLVIPLAEDQSQGDRA